MQKSISLELGLCQPVESRNLHDVVLCWRCQADDFERANSRGALFDLSDWRTIAVRGEDAVDYLQRMTTVDFKKLGEGEVSWGAFLTGRAGVVCLGQFERGADGLFLHVSRPLVESTTQHIEKFHFTETLTVTPDSPFSLLALRVSDAALERLGLDARGDRDRSTWGTEPVCSVSAIGSAARGWWDPARARVFWLRVLREEVQSVVHWAASAGLTWAGREAWELLRIRDGIASVPEELGAVDIILEGNCEWAVARNKGCYPGQEVVERIFTYGSVNRKLLSVEIRGRKLKPPIELPGATIVKIAKIPGTPDTFWGLAFVQKLQWQKKEAWTLEGSRITLLQ